MPAIFNEENKELIQQKMLDNGFELIKKYGVKRMTVAEIAKASGLAKGTFYTFFPSKEEFVYQIILKRRDMVKTKYIELIEKYGQIGRKELEEFFAYIREADISAYKYMTEQDLNYLATKWPKEYNFNPKADEETTLWLMKYMKDINKDVNWKVLANFMKTLAMMEMSQDMLHADALAETSAVFREGILDYLYRKE